MRTYHCPFVSGLTLTFLYPTLVPFLKTVPNHLDGKVRVYDAFIALDVVNRLRRELSPPMAEPVPVTKSVFAVDKKHKKNLSAALS